MKRFVGGYFRQFLHDVKQNLCLSPHFFTQLRPIRENAKENELNFYDLMSRNALI